jgi:hypothetical protein
MKMAYKLDSKRMYMMPVHFGSMTGPRHDIDGGRFPNKEHPKSTRYSVSFLTNREQLEEMIPEGFEVIGEPVATVFTSHMKEIEWLAGRGYNVLGLNFMVRYNGKKDTAEGPFLTVLWENLTDPILTGREQLGFNKIYCELPDPVVYGGATHLTASWLGFRFLDIKLSNMKEMDPKDYTKPGPARSDGIVEGQMHYKYIPKTGVWGEPDVAYPVISPSGAGSSKITGMWKGDGTIEFQKARWEDLPTQFRIVNAFAALEIKEYRGAVITQSVGGDDLYGQRILE